MHVFGLQEEATVPRENRHKHGENFLFIQRVNAVNNNTEKQLQYDACIVKCLATILCHDTHARYSKVSIKSLKHMNTIVQYVIMYYA